jgi:hypothetical protein
LPQDGAQRSFGHIAGVMWDRGVALGLEIKPDFMASRRMSMEFKSAPAQTLNYFGVFESAQPPMRRN